MENNQDLVDQVEPWMITWSRYLLQQLKREHSAVAEQLIQQLLLALSRGESCIDLNEQTSYLQGVAVDYRQLPKQIAPLVYDEQALYLYRYWQLEQQVARHTVRLQQQQVQSVDITDYAHLLQDQHQQSALQMVAKQGLSLITGGPGTGKTYTLARIIAVLNHAIPNLRIAMAAPTGKAAQRMKQALDFAFADPALNALGLVDDHLRQLETFTLHRLLGLGFHRPARFNAEQPLPYDLIVVDEASMLDLQLAAQLFEAIASPCRLILLGDAKQLASVDVGSVLADLQQVTVLQANRVNLLTSRRFKAGALIGKMAQFIQAVPSSAVDSTQLIQRFQQEVVQADQLCKLELTADMADVIQLEFLTDHPSGIQRAEYYHQLSWGFQAYFDGLAEALQLHQQQALSEAALVTLLERFDQYRILVAVRHGDFGLYQINLAMEQALLQYHPQWIKQGDWYVGRPVMITQNDDQLGLSNGDIGICLPHRSKAGQFEVYFASTALWIAATRLPKTIQTAFAMTIHKSQGSEFKHVAVVFDYAAQRVLSQELLYTAITRAKSAISLLVHRDTFLQSLTLKTLRKSGLVHKISDVF